MRRIVCEQVLNMRDLGGYPVGFNQYTQYNQFLRSAVPQRITDKELAHLKQMGITTVIDLRTLSEIQRTPCAFANKNDFDYHHIPLFDDLMLSQPIKEMGEFYFDIVKQYGPVAKVFSTIANAKQGVLFHCTAGKDRTGVIASLLLSLVGVNLCDIVVDYQMTEQYIKDLVQKLKIDYPHTNEEMFQSRPIYIETFFNLFLAEYTDTESYLLSIGITNEEIQQIKNKLLTNACTYTA